MHLLFLLIKINKLLFIFSYEKINNPQES